MEIGKKAVSLLLSFVLAFSLLPVHTLAAANGEYGGEVNLFALDEADYPSGNSPDIVLASDESLTNESVEGRSADAIASVTNSVGSVSASAGQAEEENPVAMESLLTQEAGAEGDGEQATLQAGFSLDLSTETLCLLNGATSTVILTLYNPPGGTVGGEISNGDIVDARWGNYTETRFPCRISAKNVGDTDLTFMYWNSDGALIGTITLQISVIASAIPKITVSRTSLNIERRTQESVTVTHNLPYSNVYVAWEWGDNGVMDCAWAGHWNDRAETNFTFYVTGKESGSSWVTFTLRNRFDEILAYAYINPVSVYAKDNPSLSISPSSVSLYTGESSRIRITVGGMSGKWYLNARYYSYYYEVNWQKINSTTYDLYITAINSGNKSVEIQLFDGNNNMLKSVTVGISIQEKLQPRLVPSRSSISLMAGTYTPITFTAQDISEQWRVTLEPSRENAIGWNWVKNENGRMTANIAGYSTDASYPVNLSLTATLVRSRDGAVLHSQTIPVSITKPQGTPPMAYGFENYKAKIPQSTWEIIYGSSEQVSRAAERLTRGGVCYGISASSALAFYNVGSLGVSNYRNIRSLNDMTTTSLANQTLNFRLKEIIEAMHVTQFSLNLDEVPNRRILTSKSGTKAVSKKIISEINAGRPVVVTMSGVNVRDEDDGHAVLAYAVSYPTSTEMLVRVYDPNSLTAATLSFTREGASGDYTSWYFSNLDWGAGKPNADISYNTFSDISKAWNNRSVNKRAKLSEAVEGGTWALLITSEKSFELYRFNEDEPWSDGILILRCRNGNCIDIDENVMEIRNYGILPDGTAPDEPLTFLLPADGYYIFKDLSLEDGVEAVLSDKEHSVTVSTEAHSFSFYAQDVENAVGAHVDAENGELFSVSIGSSAEGEPDRWDYDGIGVSGGVSVSLSAGALTETGMEGANVSISTGEATAHYSVNEQHTKGGSVTFEEGRHIDLCEGDSCLAYITPDEGYEIASVCVDGAEIGPTPNYAITDIADNHQIEVVFRRNLSDCNVKLSGYSEDVEPLFVLTNQDGEELIESEDYHYRWLSDEENCVAFLANEEGSYMGALVHAMDEECPKIIRASMDENHVVNLKLSTTVSNSTILVAFYDESGKMLFLQSMDGNAEELSLDFRNFAFPSAYHASAFWVDKYFKPLCEKAEIK